MRGVLVASWTGSRAFSKWPRRFQPIIGRIIIIIIIISIIIILIIIIFIIVVIIIIRC